MALRKSKAAAGAYRALEASRCEFCYDNPMISQIRGTVLETTERYAVIDVGGIGYKVFATADSLHALKDGSQARLWTYLAVREDALDLYGFPSSKERGFFELLLTVSGIGPKSALNILSLVSTDTLAGAIRTGSVSHLVKISGIGKKTAEKIVLELKDKLGGFSEGDFGQAARTGMSSDSDAMLALQALGYDADESREALKEAAALHIAKHGPDTQLDASAKIKAALKLLGK